MLGRRSSDGWCGGRLRGCRAAEEVIVGTTHTRVALRKLRSIGRSRLASATVVLLGLWTENSDGSERLGALLALVRGLTGKQLPAKLLRTDADVG